MSTKKSKSRAAPAVPCTSPLCLAHSLQTEDWPAEAQKVNDEQLQAFYREYAKTAPEKGAAVGHDDHIRRITAALAQYTTRLPGGKALPEEFLRQGSEHVLSPTPEELMELYATLLRDNLDLNPKMREVLTDQAFAASTLLHGDQFDQHFRLHQHHANSQHRTPCGCGIDHGDEALGFPDDSYEDEPDDEDEDEEDDEDGEEDDEEEDSMDDDEYDDDDEQDVVDGYAHHYEESNVKMMAYEEDKLKLETVRRVREEERRLKEELRKKRISERLKQKQEKERILLLQRLRLEDEERRKREVLEKQRRERLEEEMRKKREAAEADQNARSFLFQCTMRSQIETVKQIICATPDNSCSLTGVPRFSTTAATRLFGWEFMTMVEGVGEVSEEKGVQETLLHVAVRVGCIDLATFFMDKGAPLDALDKDGLTPLHTAAKYVAPFEICKVLVERTAHHIDRTCIVSGKTTLHYAAQNGYAELVSLLLLHHARINSLDHKGNTPESLAKSGLENSLAEKPSKSNTKQANTAKAQRYRNTMQHLQKAMLVLKEAQSRKDAHLEELRRKDEALAREEAEKDQAARRKQEEKLGADLRRRLEEEKELERLKAMASDPNGNNSNSSKKKKKKKGKGGNEAPSAVRETPLPTSTASTISRNDPSPESAPPSSANLSVNVKPAHGSVSTHQSSVPATVQSSLSSSTASKDAQPTSDVAPTSSSALPSSQPAPGRIPKPKTSYRPSQLVVTRMTDMGFPLRESRKALIQTEGRVEDAIDLLTSGTQLADDSEDEMELAAERARAKAKANAANAAAKATPARPQDPYVNGHGSAIRPPHQVHPNTAQAHLAYPGPYQHQQPSHQRMPHNTPPGMQQMSPRPINHPVHILQRTHAVPSQVQPRSVPTQVLQRPPPHGHNIHPQVNPQNQTMRKSYSGQGQSASPMSSPSSHSATSIASFIAPRTTQPVPPTRAPYSYGPTSSSAQGVRPLVSPPISAGHVNHPSLNRMTGSTSASALDRNAPGRGSAGEVAAIEMARKFGGMDISDHQNFGSPSSFLGFSAAASTWDVNINGKTPTSQELPLPISTGYPPSSMGHNLWTTPGLSLPGPSLLQSVGDNSVGSAFGPSFLTTLPATQQQQQLQPHQQHPRPSTVGSSMNGLQSYSESDLDLGKAGDEMIKDVLAMTGAIDSDEFAKFDAEYSLLDSGMTNSGPSRAVGDGRSNGSSPNSGAPPMANLWGSNVGNIEGHHGLPSPIGTVNGHAFSSSRRGLDSGFDSHGTNGLLSESKGNVSEYSQWNSGFALDKAMYPSALQQHHHQQQQQGSPSAYVDSFFGSNAGVATSPYSQHVRAHQQNPQPLSPFDYSSFGGLGGSTHGSSSPVIGAGASATLPTTASSFGSIGAIGSSRHQQHHQNGAQSGASMGSKHY